MAVMLWQRFELTLHALSLLCLSGLIRRFALHNLCDLNPTSWAASVAQLVEQLVALKAGGRGFESHLSSLFPMKIEKRALVFVAFEV